MLDLTAQTLQLLLYDCILAIALGMGIATVLSRWLAYHIATVTPELALAVSGCTPSQ